MKPPHPSQHSAAVQLLGPAAGLSVYMAGAVSLPGARLSSTLLALALPAELPNFVHVFINFIKLA